MGDKLQDMSVTQKDSKHRGNKHGIKSGAVTLASGSTLAFHASQVHTSIGIVGRGSGTTLVV